MAMQYMVLGPDGYPVAVEKSVEAASRVAARAGFEVDLSEVPDGDGDEVRENPNWDLSQERIEAASSLTVAGLPQVTLDEVSDLTDGLSDPRAAFELVRPHFAHLREKGRLPASMSEPDAFLRTMLSSNFKMAKELSGFEGEIKGLALTPYWLADYLIKQGVDKSPQTLAKVSSEFSQFDQRPAGHRNMCRGSSPACRAGCLVLTGQNVAPYAMMRKVAMTRALFEQPVAFCALLAMAIHGFAKRNLRAGRVPFVRLNVLQDLPWEALFPGLFEIFRGMDEFGPTERAPFVPSAEAIQQAQLAARSNEVVLPCEFYDYTKVYPVNRTIPPNYDLTYSFNGMNETFAKRCLEHGFRVAVVMMPGPRREQQGSSKQRLTQPHTINKKAVRMAPQEMPETFWGVPVVDGDASDFRARDPGGVVVALIYKRPKLVESRLGLIEETSGFVVPVWPSGDPAARWVAASTPYQHHAEEFQEEG